MVYSVKVEVYIRADSEEEAIASAISELEYVGPQSESPIIGFIHPDKAKALFIYEEE